MKHWLRKSTTIVAMTVGVLMVFPKTALASGPPAAGIAVEGVSVPGGVALGDLRDYVEDPAVYGPPGTCDVYETSTSCKYQIEGVLGAIVTVVYQHQDDGSQTVIRVSWSTSVRDWVTTAGVSTQSSRQEVTDAYPDAEIRYPINNLLYSVNAWEQGFRAVFYWHVYGAFDSVDMSIFTPREPPVRPDPPDPTVHVEEINMQSVKRDITATVRVQNHYGWNTRGVTVTGTWLMPRGKTEVVTGVTDSFGLVTFYASESRKGLYTFTVNDLVLEDHTFDQENSILTNSVNK
ncbi:MAG: hypothetical protein ACYSUD_01550 [Planctomycetota bacterium]|jgi:hypothetical protein